MQNKEIEKEENNKQEKNPESKKMDRQMFWVVGTMSTAIIIFLISFSIFTGFSSFDYQELSFTKEKFGEIPVFHHNYYFKSPNGELINYNLFLRHDPRKNGAGITGRTIDGIEFSPLDPIFLSIGDEGIVGCEYAGTGISTLTTFLTDNQLQVKGASYSRERAEENNLTYTTCETYPQNYVIILKGGETTELVQETDKCYSINIANCEIMQGIERFQLQAVLDARARKYN